MNGIEETRVKQFRLRPECWWLGLLIAILLPGSPAEGCYLKSQL
jgi:hypothetical protein